MNLPDIRSSIGIYWIVSPNGSCYIGATTVSFISRYIGHKRDFAAKRTKCSGLFRAFLKYGEDNMAYGILEVVDNRESESVWAKETEWWDRLSAEGFNIYNGRPVGKGVIHTLETRRKISAANSGVNSKTGEPSLSTIARVCKLEICSKLFYSSKRKTVFCSPECAVAFRSKAANITASDLIDLYVEKKMTLAEVGDIFSVSSVAIHRKLIEFGIPARGRRRASEAKVESVDFASILGVSGKRIGGVLASHKKYHQEKRKPGCRVCDLTDLQRGELGL